MSRALPRRTASSVASNDLPVIVSTQNVPAMSASPSCSASALYDGRHRRQFPLAVEVHADDGGEPSPLLLAAEGPFEELVVGVHRLGLLHRWRLLVGDPVV